jgi:small conductance mechanosensitive channel
MDKAMIDSLISRGTDFGLKVLAAFAVWIIGRWVIGAVLKLVVSRLRLRKLDETVIGYARNTASSAMSIALAVVILSVLGIETTSFAAFIASVGFAIGAAWSGLLGHLAAGAFIVILRPFKKGDHVSAGGVTGVIDEIGLFVTTILTEDHVQNFVGNGTILAGNVKNFSATPARRVDLSGTMTRTGNLDRTITTIRERLLRVPNVLAEPAPEVRIMSFDEDGLGLAVRPFAHTDHYWQVVSDATSALRDILVALRVEGTRERVDESEDDEKERERREHDEVGEEKRREED